MRSIPTVDSPDLRVYNIIMSDLSRLEGKKAGYYQGAWVDRQGHVGGWIAEVFAGPETDLTKVDTGWVSPPFIIMKWDGTDVECIESLGALQKQLALLSA